MENNIQAAINAGRNQGKIDAIEVTGIDAPAVIIPCDSKLAIPVLAEVEAWLEQPVRKRGTFYFKDVPSFVRYFNEHKTPDSRIFASITDTAASFSAVLNFHGAEPAWGDHKCTATLTPTHEWQAWTTHNKLTMFQQKFCEFLEENASLFTTPSGADLLELVQSLQGHVNAEITSAIRLQSGAIKIQYAEEVELKGGTGSKAGEMEIPSLLKVSLAPFEGTPFYDMAARLRYRIADRKLTFWYETVDQHVVMRVIAADLVKFILAQTGIEPFRV